MSDAHDCLKNVLTVPEAARLVGIAETTLRRACERRSFDPAEARSAGGGVWLLAADAVMRRFGGKRAHGLEGIPATKAARARGLGLAQVLERRAEFGPGELWRQGRVWMASPEAAERVLGPGPAEERTT